MMVNIVRIETDSKPNKAMVENDVNNKSTLETRTLDGLPKTSVSHITSIHT